MKRFTLLLAIACAGWVSAQEAGRYQVAGSEPGWGAFRGEVRLESRVGRVRYVGVVRFADGSAGALRGTLYPGAGGALLVEELLRGGGISGALGGLRTRRRVGRLAPLLAGRGQVTYPNAGQRASWRQRSRAIQVRVMSYNVLGFKADWVRRGRRVAAAIRAADPDIVCLQEVVGLTRGRSSQVNGLARRAGGFRARFEGFRQYSFVGPWMGNAVLSRWPIQGFARTPLPRGPRGFGDYPRGVTWARLSHPSGARLDVGSLHLHQRQATADRALRVEQTRAAERAEVRRGAALRLLVGDYNAEPGSDTVAVMTGSGWQDLWVAARPTDPGYTASVLGSGRPKRIDYAFARAPAGARLRASRASLIGPRTQGDRGDLLSDHRALVVELTLEVPSGP